MLVIRREQMQIFERQSLEACVRFVRRIVLEQVFDKTVGLPDNIMDKRIRSGILRAEQYELATYSDIAIFVSLLFAIGPSFDQHPFVASVLSDPDLRSPELGADERMTVLTELATQRDWIDAYESGGQGAWLREE